jgi:hypothetical protein
MNNEELYDLLKKRASIDAEIDRKQNEIKELVKQMMVINLEIENFRIGQQLEESK